METKICIKCSEEKGINDFYFRKDSNNYRSECKICFNRIVSEKRKDNPEYIKNYLKKYREVNKNRYKKLGEKYRNKNSDKLKIYFKNRRVNNPEYFRNLYNSKILTDNLFKVKESVRKCISGSFRYRSFRKKNKTIDILGCTFEYFKTYLESKFEPWMTWENKGLYNGEINYGWDLDHIIPLSSAKNEEEVIKLNHYTNLQPLCSYTNRYIKGDNLFFLPL